MLLIAALFSLPLGIATLAGTVPASPGADRGSRIEAGASVVANRQATLTAGCPGTINFDNSAGTGLWQTAANWDTNTLPSSTDDVCIAGFAVTVSSGSHAVRSLTVDSAGSLAISDGNLDLSIASQIDGTFLMANGSLSGSGDLTVNGATSWVGGALSLMSGTGRTKFAGGMTLSGPGADLRSGRVLEVPAGATVNMSANLVAESSATIENSGTWNVTNDSGFLAFGGGTRTILNLATGLLRKTGGAGVTAISWQALNNAGTVEVQSGELWPGFGTHTGTFSISAGTLNLRNLVDFNAGSSVTGPGRVLISGQDANFNAGSSFTPGGTTEITGGRLTLNTGTAVTIPALTFTGGDLAGADNIEVTGLTSWGGGGVAPMNGTGRTKVSGGLTIAGSGAWLRGGRTLEVPAGATVTMSAHLVADSGSATVENAGTWNVTNDSSLLGFFGTYVNLATGVFRKTGGTGVTENRWVALDNAGTVEVQSGELQPGFGTHTGPFSISAGTLNLRNVATFNSGSSVTGSGRVLSSGTTTFNAGSSFAPGGTTEITGGRLTLNTGAAVTMAALTFTGGDLAGADNIDVTGATSWDGGVMYDASRTKVSGSMTLTGSGGTLRGGRVLEVGAGATVTMSANLVADSGSAALENAGVWNITNDADILAFGGGTRTIANLATGALRKTAGAGLSSITWGSLSNAGSVESLAGTLQVPSYTQSAGTTRADAATLSSTTAMGINGGSVTGTGTISTPSLMSSGELRPGGSSPGSLSVSGNYTQQTAGRYRAQVGGLVAGTDYDQASVTESVTLGGELVLELLNGFTPAFGDSFTLMTFASRGGTTFATFAPSPAPCGLAWNLAYSNTSVVAQVVAGACPDVDGDGFANCCHPQCFLIGGDTCGDCNDEDAGAVALPQEAHGLVLGSNRTTLSWTSVIPPAGTATVHDVATGLIAELPVGSGASETCLGTTSASTIEDTSAPDAGAARWYLVRGRNSCGAGTYGTRSNGIPNVTGACP